MVTMATNKATYKVLRKENNMELRLYDPMILVSTQESTLSGASGFSRVFNFINGYNDQSRKIAMTTPVFNEISSTSMTTAFVMPNHFDSNTLPKPKDKQVQVIVKGETLIVACSFSGNVSEKVVNKKAKECLDWANQQKLKVVGSMLLARYQPPFIPWFLKRSDVMFEVELHQ